MQHPRPITILNVKAGKTVQFMMQRFEPRLLSPGTKLREQSRYTFPSQLIDDVSEAKQKSNYLDTSEGDWPLRFGKGVVKIVLINITRKVRSGWVLPQGFPP